jgi:hypothetical protein
MPVGSSKRYATGLWLFLTLFAVRVVAQPLSLVVHSAILPPFESWHSGASLRPAGRLAGGYSRGSRLTACRFTTDAVTPRHSIGVVALTLGGLYFLAMVVRLVLGLTVLSHQRWFVTPPHGVSLGARAHMCWSMAASTTFME